MSILGIVGSLAGGFLALRGAKKAADAQSDAAQSAAATQRYFYDTSREDYQPWQQAGASSVNRMSALMGLGSPDAREDAASQFYQDPGYQFRFNEGQRALENSMLARGQGLSGNAGRALVDYGQGMGSQEYGNYYNRLANLAGAGQNAVGNLANTGANAGRGIGAAQMGAGQARGSGYIGQADAWGNALQGAMGSIGYSGMQNPFANWGTTNYNQPTFSNPNARPIYTPWGGR